MDELKTLKDFEIPQCEDVCPNECAGAKKLKEELKQDAIKDIKRLRDYNPNTDEKLNLKQHIYSYRLSNETKAVIEYTTKKFNLTKKDLK